jgi:hypothetical protein
MDNVCFGPPHSLRTHTHTEYTLLFPSQVWTVYHLCFQHFPEWKSSGQVSSLELLKFPTHGGFPALPSHHGFLNPTDFQPHFIWLFPRGQGHQTP